MSVATGSRTATLSHAQREAVCEFLLTESQERACGDGEWFRLGRVAFRLFDALDWRRDGVPDRDVYEVVVDPDVSWLAAEVLEPYAEGCVPYLEEMLTEPEEPEFPEFLVDSDEARAYWLEWRAKCIAEYEGIIGGSKALTEAVA